MNFSDLQALAVSKVKSASFKDAINKEKTIFTPVELCKFIYEYVEMFDDRIYLFREMKSVTEDVQLRDYIAFLIDNMETQMDFFKKQDPEFIFELHIKDTPDSYDERYICNSFDSAIRMIDEFCKEYECDKNAISRYIIKKRKIYNGSSDHFDEDFRGGCSLNSGKKICKFYPYESVNYHNCDGMCCKCNRLCIMNITISFPVFTGYKDLVRFYDSQGKSRYGVCLDDADIREEVCYIIPLDCFALRYHFFEKVHDFHMHIPYPYVEKVNDAELNEEEQKIYKEYTAYLEKN